MDPGGEQFARLAHFADLVAGRPGRRVPLDAAALAMSAVLRSRPTRRRRRRARRARRRLPDARRSRACARHLFDELGFAGDQRASTTTRATRSSTSSSSRRRGLPILLATVVIEVGRRVGVPAVGIGMPMHFLVRAADDDDAFVDPFTRRGARPARAPAGASSRSPTAGCRGTTATSRRRRPRLIVVRMLTNLQVVLRAPVRPRRPGPRRADAGGDPRAARRRARRRGACASARRAQLSRMIDRDDQALASGQMIKGIEVVGAAPRRRVARAYTQPLGQPGQLRGADRDGQRLAEARHAPADGRGGRVLGVDPRRRPDRRRPVLQLSRAAGSATSPTSTSTAWPGDPTARRSCPNSIAWLRCATFERMPMADHELFFARVVDVVPGRLREPPLLYSQPPRLAGHRRPGPRAGRQHPRPAARAGRRGTVDRRTMRTTT